MQVTNDGWLYERKALSRRRRPGLLGVDLGCLGI